MTTASYAWRGSSRICSTCSARDQLRELRGGRGAARTCRPESWRVAYVRSSSGSRSAASSRTSIDERLPRREVQVCRDLAELEVEVDEQTWSGLFCAIARRAMFVAIVVVPAPPLGLKTTTIRRRERRTGPSAVDRPAPGSSTAGSGAAAPRPEPRARGRRTAWPGRRRRPPRGTDPLLDVVGLADAQHRDDRQGGRRPDLLTDVEPRCVRPTRSRGSRADARPTLRERRRRGPSTTVTV